MERYSDWIWSPAHGRFYMYQYGDDDVIMETLWSDPPEGQSEVQPDEEEEAPMQNVQNVIPYTHSPQYLAPVSQTYATSTQTLSHESTRPISTDDIEYAWEYTDDAIDASTQDAFQIQPTILTSDALGIPQEGLNTHQQQTIITDNDPNTTESLDPRYRRIPRKNCAEFFVPGRVFAMLWEEPAAGASSDSRSRSTESLVRFGEDIYREIRHFVVVKNKGSFSQCVPIHTYGGRGTTKWGVRMDDHSIIYTDSSTPSLLPGEDLKKDPIRVKPAGRDILTAASRINYGKSYAVEHNVKVHDLGMVDRHDLKKFTSYYNETRP